MSRAKFTQSDLDRLLKAAAKSGVPIVAEFTAPDGTKITITAGTGGARSERESTDLDKWLRDHDARATEGD